RALPELPEARKRRFIADYGIPEYDAGVLTASPEMADFYEECVALYGPGEGRPKTVSNWVMGELARYLNANGLDIGDARVTPRHIVDLINLIDAGSISGKIAKSIFDEMCDSGAFPGELVKRKGLVQISDEAEIVSLVRKAVEENPKVVQDYRSGKTAALGFFVGQVMKATKGKANPALVNRVLRDLLD
ncbi:MAG: Asp-tRNA(Asn)/Glu-tRNA(Gln) amidotransferase GatCAB subunit B, partial [Bacillota bacterium]